MRTLLHSKYDGDHGFQTFFSSILRKSNFGQTFFLSNFWSSFRKTRLWQTYFSGDLGHPEFEQTFFLSSFWSNFLRPYQAAYLNKNILR